MPDFEMDLIAPKPIVHGIQRPHDGFSRCSVCVFAIEDGELLEGNMPRRQTRLIQAWIELHRDELNAAWSLAVRGEEIFKIDPLR